MQTKPGSLLKSAQPDVSTVLAEMQVLKEQMATMLGAVETVQTKAWCPSLKPLWLRWRTAAPVA